MADDDDNLLKSAKIFGTKAYAPPEMIFMDWKTYSTKSDLWYFLLNFQKKLYFYKKIGL